MSPARTLMVQGTASGVGKTLLVAGLCRHFARQGLRVAPFKAQNMSNNAAVCPGGGEIGRAQALQAAACGLEPSIDMNPILLKPTADLGSQVVVMGRPFATLTAAEYHHCKPSLVPQIQACLERLRASHDLVLIEGAGSPAEVNLRDHDIVNMRTAALAHAPVLLVGDIDWGGVFAQLIGTLQLLRPAERARVRGLVVNKFRGDPALMRSGLDFLERETGRPVLGLMPFLRGLELPEEDGAVLRSDASPVTDRDALHIEVVRHPRIANFSDFDALRGEPDVALRYVDRPGGGRPDAIVLPGTKNTAHDLRELRARGFEPYLREAHARGAEIVGICGGFQMLGERVCDPHGAESGVAEEPGLGLLPGVTTVFAKDKNTSRVRARHLASGLEVQGYEIHMGRTEGPAGPPLFEVLERDGSPGPGHDGLAASEGQVWGTYLHGVFDAPAFRRHFLNRLRARRGLAPLDVSERPTLGSELDRVADWIRAHLDVAELERIIEVGAL